MSHGSLDVCFSQRQHMVCLFLTTPLSSHSQPMRSVQATVFRLLEPWHQTEEEISGFFNNSAVSCDVSLEAVLWEGMQCFAESRHLRGWVMCRKNRSRTPQTVRALFCSAVHWSSLVFIGLHWSSLVEKNVPKKKKSRGILTDSGCFHQPIRLVQIRRSLTVSAGSCRHYWFLFAVWCLLLNCIAGILTTESGIAPNSLLLNRSMTLFSY